MTPEQMQDIREIRQNIAPVPGGVEYYMEHTHAKFLEAFLAIFYNDQEEVEVDLREIGWSIKNTYEEPAPAFEIMTRFVEGKFRTVLEEQLFMALKNEQWDDLAYFSDFIFGMNMSSGLMVLVLNAYRENPHQAAIDALRHVEQAQQMPIAEILDEVLTRNVIAEMTQVGLDIVTEDPPGVNLVRYHTDQIKQAIEITGRAPSGGGRMIVEFYFAGVEFYQSAYEAAYREFRNSIETP